VILSVRACDEEETGAAGGRGGKGCSVDEAGRTVDAEAAEEVLGIGAGFGRAGAFGWTVVTGYRAEKTGTNSSIRDESEQP